MLDLIHLDQSRAHLIQQLQEPALAPFQLAQVPHLQQARALRLHRTPLLLVLFLAVASPASHQVVYAVSPQAVCPASLKSLAQARDRSHRPAHNQPTLQVQHHLSLVAPEPGFLPYLLLGRSQHTLPALAARDPAIAVLDVSRSHLLAHSPVIPPAPRARNQMALVLGAHQFNHQALNLATLALQVRNLMVPALAVLQFLHQGPSPVTLREPAHPS